MIIITSVILFCLWASMEGKREARHYYYRASSNRQDAYDEHAGFAIQRIIAWIPFEYILFDPSNRITALNGILLALMFILIHDGAYYRAYNKLTGAYPLGFWTNISHTSTSFWDQHDLTNVVLRITYFVVGLLGLIIVNYAKY